MPVRDPADAVVAADSLSSGAAGVLLAVMIGGSLAAGLIIVGARALQKSPQGEQPQSIVRSWLAVALVLGLLTCCAAAFELNDKQLRNTLLGGLVASTGAATAFYFSSKGADAARADILNTTKALARGAVAPTAFSASAPTKAIVGDAYSYRFVADGSPPLSYSVASGKPPKGLELDPSGQLLGTPTEAGSATFTVVATNALGSVASEPVTLDVQATQP